MFSFGYLPDLKVGADSIPEIHDFTTEDIFWTTFNSIDAD